MIEPREATSMVVVGMQWGDEGKGKIVDALAEHFDIVARYQGGANAGHTVYIGGKKYVLQLIPTGILRPEKKAALGHGVVVDAEAMRGEVLALEKSGVSVEKRLLISDRAHLILPYHRLQEAAAELARGDSKIGTTSKGIGPAYEDKAARRGLRTGDLRNRESFIETCRARLREKAQIAKALTGNDQNADESWIERYFDTAQWIVPHLTDVSAALNAALDRGERVLFEGAQGTLLDLDHGTYPFVTSSNATAGGASTGTGVGPTRIGGVIGVSKAYATRVGSGPFPTEALDPEGETLRARGGEYGAVTGRPRRCGWFDVPAARYAARLNHLSAMIVTKLDVLDELEEIPVGIGYELAGRRFDDFPQEAEALGLLKPLQKKFPGWRTSTAGIRNFSKLPQRARDYLRFLADAVGVEIAMVSTGPERGDEIWLEESRAANQIVRARC